MGISFSFFPLLFLQGPPGASGEPGPPGPPGRRVIVVYSIYIVYIFFCMYRYMKCLFAHAHAILCCFFQGHVGAAGKEGKQGMKGAKVSSKNSDLSEESFFDLFCYWCLALASVSWLCRGQVDPRDQWGRQAQWDLKDSQEGLVQKGFEAFQVQRYVYGCKIVFLFKGGIILGNWNWLWIPYTLIFCVCVFLQGEPGLNGPLGQTGPPGPIVGFLYVANIWIGFHKIMKTEKIIFCTPYITDVNNTFDCVNRGHQDSQD